MSYSLLKNYFFNRLSSKSLIFSTIVLSFLSFFYLFTFASFFKLQTFPFYNRITFFFPFDIYIINEYFDHIIILISFVVWFGFSFFDLKIRLTGFLISVIIISFSIIYFPSTLGYISISTFPIIVLLIVISKFFYKKNIFHKDLFPKYILLTAIFVGFLSFFEIIPSILSPSVTFEIHNYSYDLITIFSSFSFLLLLLLVNPYPSKIIINFIKNSFSIIETISYPKKKSNFKTILICFTLISIFSMSLVIIPHLYTINPTNQNASVDTGFYVNWIDALDDSSSYEEFLSEAFLIQSDGDRPLSLIFFYTLFKIFNFSLTDTIEYLGILLGPLLAISVFFLTRELTSNDHTSLLAAFLTVASFQTLIGIYAGFYSNWIALVIGFFALLFLLKTIKTFKKLYLVIFGLLFVVLHLTHTYTWAVFSPFVIIYLLVLLKFNFNRNRKILFLLILVSLSPFVIDLIKINIPNTVGGLEKDIEKLNYLSGLDQFPTRIGTLQLTTTTMFGGIFSNILILLPVLYWLAVTPWKDKTSIFLMIFMSLGSLSLLFGQWPLQSRLLYDIPFQIPVAIALIRIKSYKCGNTFLIFILLWISSLAFRTVSNFYFLPVE